MCVGEPSPVVMKSLRVGDTLTSLRQCLAYTSDKSTHGHSQRSSVFTTFLAICHSDHVSVVVLGSVLLLH